MPRGPVVYTLPPGTTPQVPNTLIASATFNAFADDVAQTLNTIQPEVFGGTNAATFIDAWDNINARGANIASAATLNLDNATGANLHMTGNVAVTAVTLASGAEREVIADGASLLTASANFIVNGSIVNNYLTSAGDLLTFIGDPASVVRVWAVPAAISAGFTGTGLIVRQTSPTITTPILSGGRTVIRGNSEVFAAGFGYSGSSGLAYIGGSNSATPDLIISQVGGSQVLRAHNSTGVSVGTNTADPGAGNLTVTGGSLKLLDTGDVRVDGDGTNGRLIASGTVVATWNSTGMTASQITFPGGTPLSAYAIGTTALSTAGGSISSSSGTITTATGTLNWVKIGRLVTAQYTIAIPSPGSGAGYLSAALPFTADSMAAVGAGRDGAGAGAYGYVPAGGTTVQINRYDGTTVISTGSVTVTVSYRAAS